MIELDIHKKLSFQGGELSLKVDTILEKGSFTTLYGESGSGKTSTLKMLSGLLRPDKGKIKVNKVTWFDGSNKINLKPQQRNLGFVFQDYALFPNMTVRENLTYALNKRNKKILIDELIELIELGELQGQKPHKLSGGQQQRLALARTLVQQPSILLLDEALSAVDAKMRTRLQDYLAQMHRELGLTILMVSHDVSEILRLSDRVLLIEQGKIVKDDSPIELFGYKDQGKGFQISGEIITIVHKESGVSLRLLIGNDLVEVNATLEQGARLKTGDLVELSSGNFSPEIQKMN